MLWVVVSAKRECKMSEKLKNAIDQIKSGKSYEDLCRVFLGTGSKYELSPEKALERFDKIAKGKSTTSERKKIFNASKSRFNKILNSIEKATDAEISKRAKDINTTPGMAKRVKAMRGDMASRFAYFKNAIESGPEEGQEGEYKKIPEIEKVKKDTLDVAEEMYAKKVRKKATGGKIYHPRSGSRKIRY